MFMLNLSKKLFKRYLDKDSEASANRVMAVAWQALGISVFVLCLSEMVVIALCSLINPDQLVSSAILTAMVSLHITFPVAFYFADNRAEFIPDEEIEDIGYALSAPFNRIMPA